MFKKQQPVTPPHVDECDLVWVPGKVYDGNLPFTVFPKMALGKSPNFFELQRSHLYKSHSNACIKELTDSDALEQQGQHPPCAPTLVAYPLLSTPMDIVPKTRLLSGSAFLQATSSRSLVGYRDLEFALYDLWDLCGLTAEDSVLQQYPILKTPQKLAL
ncbi:hypothetical protein MG293_001666 [Ovis ammon polii]|uniref:Uncharacterized protein n=1 Tax=Ovis ammon polii TaxID=230172 RepID=A0AAD4UNI0_OVIAM|nr:hypothetical protein MG293_001666 [Ovis ammon polii]